MIVVGLRCHARARHESERNSEWHRTRWKLTIRGNSRVEQCTLCPGTAWHRLYSYLLFAGLPLIQGTTDPRVSKVMERLEPQQTTGGKDSEGQGIHRGKLRKIFILKSRSLSLMRCTFYSGQRKHKGGTEYWDQGYYPYRGMKSVMIRDGSQQRHHDPPK